MDRLENLLSRIRDPRAFADLLLGTPREAAGSARQLAAVLSSSLADGSGSMEIALKTFVILVQLTVAGFVVWGAYLCISTWIRGLRGVRTASPIGATATSSQPSFERVASLVLLALLCTTLAGIA